MPGSSDQTYDQVRDRLDEIVEAVSAPGISLDDALALYEEAVKLGLSACDLSEEGAEALLEQDDASAADEPAGQATAPDDQTASAKGEGVAAATAEDGTPEAAR